MQMLELASAKPPHCNWSIAFARNNFVPPVAYGQVLWSPDRLAFCTWAWLSSEAESRWLAGSKLGYADWRSGKSLWLMDLVAPFGGAAALVRQGRELVPHGMLARWRRSAKGNRIGFLTGVGHARAA